MKSAYSLQLTKNVMHILCKLHHLIKQLFSNEKSDGSISY